MSNNKQISAGIPSYRDQLIALISRQIFGFIIGGAVIIYGLFITHGGSTERGMWAALGTFLIMMQLLNIARAMRKINTKQARAKLLELESTPAAKSAAKQPKPAAKQAVPSNTKQKRKT
jgi:hypothetical protein